MSEFRLLRAPQSSGCARRPLLSRWIGALSALALLAAPAVQAATPASGTLTDTSGPLTYDAGPFFVPNPTPIPLVDSGPECGWLLGPAQPCDKFTLTVSLPSDYSVTHPQAKFKVTLGWTDTTGAKVSDYDLWIYKGDVATTNGSQTATSSSATNLNPEVTDLVARGGTQIYTVFVVPFTPSGETGKVRIELEPGEAVSGGGGGGGGGPGTPSFGRPDPASPAAARYQIFAPPTALENSGQQNGEFNIGFNPKTGRIMTFAITFPGRIFRLTPPELLSPALPESAPALWEDKSSLWATSPQVVGDPILWTDQDTGRTFETNMVQGPNYSYAYSDDDGDNWLLPSGMTGGIGGLAGSDHETIASGPYPAGSPYEQIASARGYVGPDGKGRAVYYCSQDYPVGPASCVRSDDGGLVWGPIQIAYDTTTCRSLHGHLHVAPDGTAYLPARYCTNAQAKPEQGGAFTTNAGDSWTQFTVPGAVPQTNGSDPSVAIDSANKLYYCYVGKDGHAHVKLGSRSGNTLNWTTDTDIGAAAGVTNAAFPEAVGGDSGRAACGFLGTNDPSPNYQSLDFQGVWYLFVAQTYDGGQTWTTVNATPDDPVQGVGGIWQQGGSAVNRNLLDFNEVTLDAKGRVLFGYDDGCVTSTCIADPSKNDFAARMRVARQTGGKTLKAAYDAALGTAKAPGAPYLTGMATSGGFKLTWTVPDHGGSQITGYTVTRTPIAGGAPQNFPTSKNAYLDAGQTGSDYSYVVTATNATGTSMPSNSVKGGGSAAGPETFCATPGVTVVDDPANDDKPPLPTAGSGQGDILSVKAAEPLSASGKLIWTMKVRSLASLPPNVEWYVIFFDQNNKKWFAAMTTNEQSQPSFGYGDYNATNQGISQNIGALEPGSGYSAATGEITLIVKKANVGNPGPGVALTQVQGVTYQLVGASAAGGSLQTIDSTATGSYKLRAANACDVNNPPLAVLAATPTSGPAPLAVQFDASASSDPDAGDTVASYSFDLDGDGVFEIVDSTDPKPSHTYTAAGTYRAHLKVKDSRGLESTPVEQIITVSPAGGGSLSATLSANPTQGDVTNGPVTVSFSAAADDTYANHGSLHYAFYYGDGANSGLQSGNTASHAYSRAGTYRSHVIVTDDAGHVVDSAPVSIVMQTQVTVAGNHPNTTAALSWRFANNNNVVPATAIFDDSGSQPADGATIASYDLDYGDGTAHGTGTTAGTFTHPYITPGSYTAVLTVTDSKGGTNTASAVIVVKDSQQTTAELSVSPSSAVVGQTVTFDGSSSIPAANPNGTTIVSYQFDFGDGQTTAAQSGATATHAYSTPGTYKPSLKVTDSNGGTSSVQGKVQVSPPAPAGGGGGGALSWLTLAPLLAMGGLRRRRR